MREKRRGAVGVSDLFWTEQRGKRRGEGSMGPARERGREGGGGVRSEGVHAEGGGGLVVHETRGRWRLAAVGAVAARTGRKQGEGRAWARPGKEERGNGPAQRNSGIFDLFKRISKGSDLIRLEDGLPEF
jgi:hypothetical protein